MEGLSGSREGSALDELPYLHQPALVERRYESVGDSTGLPSKPGHRSTVRSSFSRFLRLSPLFLHYSSIIKGLRHNYYRIVLLLLPQTHILPRKTVLSSHTSSISIFGCR
jgi:hypothetical protein